MFKKLRNSRHVSITYKGLELNAKVYIPPYRSATLEEPEEGGSAEMEILSLDYKGESCLNLFLSSDMLEEIEELIGEEF